MSETTYDNQASIFRFLNKHKWRIILPLLYAAIFWAYPRYNTYPIAVQQDLFIKSSVFTQEELKQEVTKIQGKVHSNEFLQELIFKYDLYKSERSQNTEIQPLIERLRNSITLEFRDWEIVDGVQYFVWINLRKGNDEHIAELANDVTAQFENTPSFQVNKYVSKPYDSNPWRNYVFFGGLLQGLVMLVIPLILFWEVPNLFYSPKTKQTVFQPIKSDWQNELTEAKLRNQFWKAFEINIRYSFAFLSAMLQKSPLGSLFEIFRKIAS